jgi:ribonucleoside-diphosphate reductase alpha chain
MLGAKTGDWFQTNQQRARSNNSVLLLRSNTSRDEFNELFQSIKDWGEPGFVWTDDYDIIFNPCVEIGMYPKTEDGRSGWQGCNLTEINGGQCNTEEMFYLACEASAIMGTLQAGYTDFEYVDRTSPAKEIFEREALLGCSITGYTENPEILFNPEILRKGANIVKEVNKLISSIIGINTSARTTCTKPSGNASVLLGTASGIHGQHSKRYLRNVQLNKEEDLPKYLKEINPEMFEESIWSANKTDWIASFPIENESNCLFKDDLLGIKLLDKVKLVQDAWVNEGTNVDLCLNKHTRHNVSNTINVVDWNETRDYIYNNREWFAGISLLSNFGDKDYYQAPFTSVKTPSEIIDSYGNCSIFASGLIVDGLHAFNDNLWMACDSVLMNLPFEENSSTPLKKDWVRRFKKFALNYLENDLVKTSYLLKDVYLYHKWVKITNSFKQVDWSKINIKPTYTEISSTSAVACSGGKCDLF